MRRPALLAATLGAAGALVTAFAAPGSAEVAAVTVVQIPFSGQYGQPAPTQITNNGAPDVDATKVTRDGGDLIVVPSRQGQGRAIDTPDFDGASNGPRAMVKVVDSAVGNGDSLSPGTGRFMFGADFRLDAVSTGSPNDNGNNLIQRGLAGSSDQYKIQVDSTTLGFRPSCGLAQKISDTETRTAAVTSSVVVEPDQWYRVRCTRAAGTLRIVVTPYAADGSPGTAVTTSRTNIPVIDLTWPTTAPIVPMSIGGKLNPDGTIVNQSDQFNGAIDNAILTLG